MLVIGSSQAQALVEELAPLLRSTPPDAAAIGAAFAKHGAALDKADLEVVRQSQISWKHATNPR